MPPAQVPDKYTWDALRRVYINDATGKVVTPWQQRQIGLRIVNKSAAAMKQLAEDYVEGAASFEEWAVGMREAVKSVHSAMSQFAYGGKAQMGVAERGRLGATIRDQYKYLSQFALEVEAGRVEVGDALIARSEMYGKAGWATYQDQVGHREKHAGMDEERSFLEPDADHCQDCFDEASIGWAPIGSLVPIGSRQCVARCQCSMEYRHSSEAEDAGAGEAEDAGAEAA